MYSLLIHLLNTNIQFIKEFLERTRQTNHPYVFRTITKKKFTLDSPKNVSFEFDESPIGLIPGFLLKLSSFDLKMVIRELTSLSNFNMDNSLIDELFKLARPLLSIIEEYGKPVAFNTYIEPPNDVTIDLDESSCTLVELNKREVTYLIGRNGWKIEAIRVKSGANIKVVPIDPHQPKVALSKQFIRITGNKQQIQSAMQSIQNEIKYFRVNSIIHY